MRRRMSAKRREQMEAAFDKQIEKMRQREAEWQATTGKDLATMTKNCPHGDYPSLCSRCSIARVNSKHEQSRTGGQGDE